MPRRSMAAPPNVAPFRTLLVSNLIIFVMLVFSQNLVQIYQYFKFILYI